MNVPFRLKSLTLLFATLLAVGGLATTVAPAQAAEPTGTIIGVVEDAAGNPLDDVDVTLFLNIFGEEKLTKGETTTGPDGTFQFDDVEVQDDPEDLVYSVEAWDPDKDFLDAAQHEVPVADGETTTVPLTMRKGASISGKIIREDGESPAGIRVDTWETGSTTTDADGNYTVKGLPATSAHIRFTDPTGDYLDQCYDNVLADILNFEFGCEPEADPGGTTVDVPAEAQVTVKDQILTNKAGHIAGKVTDTKNRSIKGAELWLYNVATGNPLPVEPPNLSVEKGIFEIDRIPPGNWKLRVTTDRAGEDLGWAEYWWKNATTQAKATPITVKAGGTVSDLAIKLKSRAALTVKATPGVGKATFALKATKRSSGSPAGGKISVRIGTNTKTATLKDGKATITLKGLTKGKKSAKVSYAGSVNTAPASKTVSVTIK